MAAQPDEPSIHRQAELRKRPHRVKSQAKTLGEVLHTAQHPTITFRSRQVEGSAGSFSVDGELTVMGVTRPVMVQGRVTDGRVVGGATVVQSQWGIRPY
jgi:polyisoprenoid-binding protein YceI